MADRNDEAGTNGRATCSGSAGFRPGQPRVRKRERIGGTPNAGGACVKGPTT